MIIAESRWWNDGRYNMTLWFGLTSRIDSCGVVSWVSLSATFRGLWTTAFLQWSSKMNIEPFLLQTSFDKPGYDVYSSSLASSVDSASASVVSASSAGFSLAPPKSGNQLGFSRPSSFKNPN